MVLLLLLFLVVSFLLLDATSSLGRTLVVHMGRVYTCQPVHGQRSALGELGGGEGQRGGGRGAMIVIVPVEGEGEGVEDLWWLLYFEEGRMDLNGDIFRP